MSVAQRIVEAMQPIGRALMLPIAVLPIAGLLLRLGQADLGNLPFVVAAGSAIFSHLGLLFAIGVGVGLARENHGAAGLAGAVAFLVLSEGAKALLVAPADVAAGLDPKLANIVVAAWKDMELAKLSVPAGIASGLSAGFLYNRFSNIKLPEYLAFFGGRRFVPIAAGFAGLAGALWFGYGFPALEAAIDHLSHWVTASGSIGLFVYGALNRLLIVTGLHHVLNNIVWFVLGDYHGATGDLNRFFAGDPTAGAFMSGFFPVMMFGLPAACFAMYRAAHPQRRREVAGMFVSLGLTSFLTGVTEPIEFTFMFLAPALYAIHVVLTGLSMVIMDWLQVRLGFGFSAGLFDYLLNFRLASRPLWLLPVGLGYAGVYYATFSYAIRRFDLRTPGRAAAAEPAVHSGMVPGSAAKSYITALGGPANFVSVDACTTRLRLTLTDNRAIDEPGLRAAGARGVIRVGANGLQVVVGPVADQLAGEMRGYLRADARAGPIGTASEPIDLSPDLPGELTAALGGLENILGVRAIAGRVVATLLDGTAISGDALDRVAPGKWCLAGAHAVHIIR